MKTNNNVTLTKKKLRRRAAMRQNLVAWALIFPALFLLYYFTFRPQILGTVWSFFNMTGYKITNFIGLENYRRVLADPNFSQALVNTFKYILWSLVIGFIPPIAIAICLDELRRFRNTARFLVYFPSILPSTATALIWYFLFYPDASGLLNMFTSVFGIEPYIWLQDGRFTILYIVIMMTWSGFGATAIYYFSALQGIQHELYEAVTIDGGGFWTKLRTVTIPHIKGIALLFFIKQIIGVFSVMEQPMLMTDGGPNGASTSLGLLIYKYGFVFNKPQFSMSLGVLMFLLLMVLTVFYYFMNRHIENQY